MQRSFVIAAAILVGTLTVPCTCRAQQEPSESIIAAAPDRKDLNVEVAFISSALLQEPIPFSGALVSFNRGSHLAIEATIETLTYFTLATVGFKGYLLNGPIAPYLAVRSGVSLQTFDSDLPPWLMPEVGIEWLHQNGFTFMAEFGPGIEWRTGGSRAYAVATLGVGYRFGVRLSRPVSLRHVEPGNLGEACAPVDGMPGAYVCRGGLVCREMRCVPERERGQ